MLHRYQFQHLQEELRSTSQHREPEQHCVTEVGSKSYHDEQSSDSCRRLEWSTVLECQHEVHDAAD